MVNPRDIGGKRTKKKKKKSACGYGILGVGSDILKGLLTPETYALFCLFYLGKHMAVCIYLKKDMLYLFVLFEKQMAVSAFI